MVHHENPEILRQCVIDALIPITKTFTLESLLNSAQFSTAEDDSASLATKVPQREALFLGNDPINLCRDCQKLMLITGAP